VYDHIGLKVSNLDASVKFYGAALAPLAHVLCSRDANGAGIGPPGAPALWLHAENAAARHGVHVAFELVDVRNWRWPPSAFDAVVSVFIQFAAPAERAQLFTGFVTTLRPNGVLVLQGYTPKQLQYKTGGPPQAEHMYTRPMLREAVAGLEIVHVREHDDVLSEGTKHVGLSALIDLVARKPG